MDADDPNRPVRCEEDDPNRCQASTPHGQCVFRAVEGGTVCVMHGGARQLQSQEKNALKNYRITLARQDNRMNDIVNSSGLKSLTDEVALMRFTLEKVINQCNTDAQLVMQSHTICSMIDKIEKLVTSCAKLDHNLSNTLDKASILRIAAAMIDAVSDTIVSLPLPEDAKATATNDIAAKIIPLIETMTNDD